MSKKLLNRVRMSVATAPGTGVITVNTAAVGFQALSADLSNGDTTSYVIEDGSPLGSVWEYGLGTWSTSGTFTRTTVLRSSVGGTTPINATANAILSATFLAGDLAPTPSLEDLSDVSVSSPATGQFLRWTGSDWANAEPPGASTPTVVQYGSVQTEVSGSVTITLGASPTAGNLLIAIGQGGNSGLSGNPPGWAPINFDFVQSVLGTVSPEMFNCGYAFRTVRSGDGATWTLGTCAGAFGFTGVLVEVAGADVSRLNQFMVTQQQQSSIGSSSTTISCLGVEDALALVFFGGGNTTVTVSSPTMLLNHNDGACVIGFGHYNLTNNYGALIANTASGAVNVFGQLIIVPGV